jgi:hypothetical protein
MVTHRGNLNYQDCRRVLVDGYVEDGPNFLDDKVGRCLTGIGLLQVCLSFVSLMCSRGAVVAMSRSMEAVVSLDDRFG